MDSEKLRYPEYHLTLPGGVVMEFVKIRPGWFEMGSPGGEGYVTEHPRHRVCITRPFYIGKYPVTQAQYEAVTGKNPSYFKGPDRPVEMISWEEAREFAHRLNRMERILAYSLPTEAQWEYVCRAGSSTTYCFGFEEGSLGGYAWYYDNSGKETHPVGKKKPNDWGLYDMHGNVWEWCQDWHDSGYYSKSPGLNPPGPSTGRFRVRRGGNWCYDARLCRSASRYGSSPGYRDKNIGFRLQRTPL